MAVTVSELVVLGLVIEKPRHGYELEQTIEQRGIRQWANLAFSSIYYVLSRLEQRGLIAGSEPERAKSRRVFTATDAGRAEAAAAVLDVVARPAPPLSSLAVGLANSALVDRPAFARGIRDRIAALDAQRGGIEAARVAQGSLPTPARRVFSYSLTMLVAERDWLAAQLNEELS